jgi:plastocyanin
MTTSLERRRRWALALVGGIAILALLGVRGGDASGASATASAAKTVDIRNFAFKPGTVRVTRGSRVTFTNSSNAAHTATKGGSFDTKRIAPGKAKAVQFNRRGIFAYHCKIHPFMKGKVVVE